MKRVVFMALFAMGLQFIACTDDDDSGEEISQEVNVEIVSPKEGDVFAGGAEVPILVNITSNAEIHGFEYKITNPNGDVLLEKHEHAHGESLTLDTSWVNNVTSHMDLTFHIVVAKDHEGNATEEYTRSFHCHPM